MTSSAYRPGTYKHLYVYCGAATEQQLMAALKFAAARLADKYKSKPEYGRTKFEISMPQSGGLQLGFAFVYCSNWEVANAICGLNLDGSLRVKYASIDDTETIWDIIKDRTNNGSSDLEMDGEEARDFLREINPRLNKVTTANVSKMSRELHSVINTVEKAKIFSTTLCKSVKNNSGVADVYAEVVSNINKEHIASFKEGYVKVSDVIVYLSKELYGLIQDGDKIEDIRKLGDFVSYLYEKNIINTEIFTGVYEAFDGDLEKCYSLIRRCIRNISKNKPAIIDDFHEKSYKTGKMMYIVWADKIKADLTNLASKKNKEKDDWEEDEVEITSTSFIRESMKPLVTLPAIKIENSQTISKIKREVERCNDPDIDAKRIRTNHIHLIAMVANYKNEFKANESQNVLLSRPVPNWISLSAIKSLASNFSTWDDDKYPVVTEIKHNSGQYKKIRVEFAKSGDSASDAAKAMCIMMKRIFVNPKGNGSYRVEFDHEPRYNR